MGEPASLHVAQGTTTSCNCPTDSTDRGQRFEVRALDDAGAWFVVGWTDCVLGGSLAALVDVHPLWHSALVVDRRRAQRRENPAA